MAITVIIDNHEIDQRIMMLIGYDDIVATELVWEKIHPIARHLVHAKLVDDLLPWSKMQPKHYQLLIKKQLEEFVVLSVKDQQDIDHDVVNTLRFLICAYVRKLSELTGSDIDVIRIQKVGSDSFSLNVSLNIILATSAPRVEPAKPKFTVIVDNTKTDT